MVYNAPYLQINDVYRTSYCEMHSTSLYVYACIFLQHLMIMILILWFHIIYIHIYILYTSNAKVRKNNKQCKAQALAAQLLAEVPNVAVVYTVGGLKERSKDLRHWRIVIFLHIFYSEFIFVLMYIDVVLLLGYNYFYALPCYYLLTTVFVFVALLCWASTCFQHQGIVWCLKYTTSSSVVG